MVCRVIGIGVRSHAVWLVLGGVYRGVPLWGVCSSDCAVDTSLLLLLYCCLTAVAGVCRAVPLVECLSSSDYAARSERYFTRRQQR